ncbi:unnamed protein product, partial [Rotaria magnacalcarata]
CIKPNHGKVANQFDEELVQEQLRYNGILEISHIRNQGWPVRFTFEEFLKRYKFISYPQSSSVRINEIACETILKQLKFNDYVIGKSKIFLKLRHFEVLNQHYEQYIKNIIICQKVIKGFLTRQKLLRKAKYNAKERHSFMSEVNYSGKKIMDKLAALPNVSAKSIQQIPLNPDDSKRLGLYAKKRSNSNKKSTSTADESIPMDEHEHTEMLLIAKKLKLLNSDEINELDGNDHQIASSNTSESISKTPNDVKSLSEREVRILVQDQFIPGTIAAFKRVPQKKFPLESNIELGTGLASTATSQYPSKFHDGNISEMAGKIPIVSAMNLTTTEQLLRQSKIAGTSGDLFTTDWAVGQNGKKHPTSVRSKSEPRNLLVDMKDQYMLLEQKRNLVKKILMIQRQKFKDNVARKSNKYENATYSFTHGNHSSPNEDDQALLNNDIKDCWDAPRTIDVHEAYESTVHCYRLSMRMLKLATYIALFIGVLLTALVSKGALLLMTNSVAKVQEAPYRERWVWMLLGTVCAPHIFTFFESLGKCLFGNKPWPTVKIFTVVFFIETLHSFGIAIFVFHILPKLDAARSLLIMNAVCLVPAFLKLFLTKSNSSIFRRSLLFLMDFFAFAMQCSCIGIALASKFLKSDGSIHAQTTVSSLFYPTSTTIIPLLNRHKRQDDPSSAGFDLYNIDNHGNNENILLSTPLGNISSIDQNLQTILAGFHIEWELPVALILVSLAWWENFVDRDIKIGGRTIVHMKLLKENILATRAKTSIIMTCWKIFVTILFAYIFHQGIFNTSVIFPINGNNEQMEDPLPKLSSGQNSWATLDFDQQPAEGVFPILPPRERRSIDNISILLNRIIRQMDHELPGSLPFDDDPLHASILGNNLAGNNPEEINPKDRWIFYLAPMIIKILSDALCFYMGRLACKLCMQRVCFALPLALVTPLALTILLVMCSVAPKSTVFVENFLFWSCYADYAKESFRWQVICGLVLWWLSELWIGGHIWFGKSQRLAFTERLFVSPRYCATLLEQSLMMNRRRNERDEILASTYDEMGAVNPESEFDEQSIEELSTEEKLRADVHTKIYSCATMWHETETEMLQLLKSIMRLDSDQCARRTARNYLHLKDLDYYEYEGHIFFDDAMEEDDNNEQVPNKFVQQLLGVVDRAATAIHQCPMKIPPPFKTPTPYGGRLTWVLPGGNFLIAHIKDKTKIRHKKRWSQVMYMYYLLGYRIFGDLNIIEKLYKRKRKKDSSKNKSKLFKGFGNLLHNMDNKKRIQMENTYLLALDGDVDFRPEAVRLLVDRMKKNKKVGAACGRIHPIGSGPVVWYQKFEYAIGHWLQKAAEHILGCVMCSPGCFSLFRGSALMDDHVLRTYCTKSTEARHYVQYDQGEDRWLCTLLLQEGYRVEYCAASDALTYAPESFHEFFNQRRRWVPSTIANIIDFLAEYKRIVLVNESISYLYIIYQLFLMISTVLGPATVLLMIIGAFNACFAVRAGSTRASTHPASYPQVDQQQLVYRGANNSRSTPYGQTMSYGGVSRPFEGPVIKRDELVNPAWIFEDSLQDSEVVMLDSRETKFFQELIERYLYPLVEDKDHQKKMVRDLKSLRNNGCFIFFMINTLWLVIIFSFQLVSERIRDYVFIPIKRLHNEPLRFEPLGLGFLLFFATILLVQFVSMLWHRYGTLLHLLASTDLKMCQRNKSKNSRSHRRGDFTTDNVEDAVEQIKALQELKGFDEEHLPEPDYNNDNDDVDQDDKLASEPDLSTTGLVYHGGSRLMRNSTCTSQQWSDTAAKVNDMQRNLDTTDHSDMSQICGYVSGSVKTYGSNYEAIKRRQASNKRHLYNKSLDHVFKSRYQALVQDKNQQQSNKNTRGKLSDVFQQQQAGLPRARRTSSALTVRDIAIAGDVQQPTAITKKHRRKSKERHLEHV